MNRKQSQYQLIYSREIHAERVEL